MRRWNKLYLWLGLCIVAFIGLALWILKPTPVDYPAYLSDSADTDGTKAITELLRMRRQGGVTRWERSWEELPSEGKMALLAVEPGPIAQKERDQLHAWLERGNDAILFISAPTGWNEFTTEKMDESGWTGSSVKSAAGRQAVALTSYDAGGQPLDGSLRGIVTSAYRILPGAGIVPIVKDSKGIVAAKVAVGSGSMAIVLEPEWIVNSLVAQYDHYELVRELLMAPSRGLWIDEYHHGYRAQPGLLAVYPAWLVLACVQLGLALLLWLWQRGKRLGPVYTPRDWVRRRGDETLVAAAGWYERRRFAGAALEHQRQQLRRLLQERWGVRPEATPEEAAEAAAGRWSAEQAAELARLLREQAPAPQGKAFVARTREMSEAIAQLEKE